MTLLYGPHRPLGPQREPRMTSHDGWVLHTMVGTLTTTDDYFGRVNGPGYDGTESTWGVGGPWRENRDGELVCWQDLERQADAQREGGARLWSIECADGGVARPLSAAQIETIARLVAVTSRPQFHASCPASWACRREGIPIVDLVDSRPGRRGFGVHRYGIDNWRVPGGEVWGGRGKTCPHDERIRQVPQILARARGIRAELDGSSAAPLTKGSTMIMLGQIAGRPEIYVGNSQTTRHVRRPSSVLRIQGSIRDWTADPDAVTVWTYADLDELEDVMGLLVTDPVDWTDLEATERAILDDLKAAPVRVADELRSRLTA